MLPITVDHLRVFLHITGAAVWVGGQLTLVGLLPAVRRAGGDTPKLVARQFSLVAWPAFAVLVLTGIWNLFEVELGDQDTDYYVTLFAKLGLVAASGVGAALHGIARSKLAIAIWGAVGLFAGIAALLLGVVLRG